MSSYLSIYIVPERKSKDEEKKHILLTSYSRSTEIYQYFRNIINPVFVGMEDRTPYTTITKTGIFEVIKCFEEDIQKSKSRLKEYEKYAKDNPDYIEEILELKEYIQDLSKWKNKTTFIQDILSDIEYNSCEVEEVCCNVD